MNSRLNITIWGALKRRPNRSYFPDPKVSENVMGQLEIKMTVEYFIFSGDKTIREYDKMKHYFYIYINVIWSRIWSPYKVRIKLHLIWAHIVVHDVSVSELFWLITICDRSRWFIRDVFETFRKRDRDTCFSYWDGVYTHLMCLYTFWLSAWKIGIQIGSSAQTRVTWCFYSKSWHICTFQRTFWTFRVA